MPRQTIERSKALSTKLIIFTATILMISYLLQFGHSEAANNMAEKRILILDSFHQDLPLNKLFLKGLQDRFEQQTDIKINYYYEYLDLQRHQLNSSYIKNLPDYLKDKYASQKIDLIIVHRRLAFDFMIRHGADIFKDIPVISVGDDRETYSTKDVPSNFTQVIGSVDIVESFKVLLQTRPQTRDIYVIIGKTELERRVKEKLLKQLAQFEGVVRINFCDELAVPEMLDKVGTITGDAAIVYIFIFKDAAGMDFVPREVLSQIVNRAKVPVYGSEKTYLGKGIVGGYLSGGEVLGTRVSDIGLDILQGKAKSAEKLEIVPAGEFFFDERELQRWGIKEKLLPPGSKIEYKEMGLFDLYRWHVLSAIILLVLETFLIAGLLTNRIKRKRAENSLLQLNTELENIVTQRTCDLEVTNSALIQLNEQLNQNSRTDMLTGLYNRRHLNENIEMEFNCYHQTDVPFSLIIADIDYFKKINDGYGHNCGDYILKIVADEFVKCIRPCDIVGRWGGEEFLFLLPATNTHIAMGIAERIRSVIMTKEFIWEEKSISLSMTFGVTVINKNDTVDTIINRADMALYRGKNTGRNRVVALDTTLCE